MSMIVIGNWMIKVFILETMVPLWMPQLIQGPVLNYSDSFSGYTQLLPCLFQCTWIPICETKAKENDLPLSIISQTINDSTNVWFGVCQILHLLRV